jgi:hypothetical protein
MILVKNITAKKRLSNVLRAVVRHLAAAGEMLVTGRIIKDNDSSGTEKSEPET